MTPTPTPTRPAAAARSSASQARDLLRVAEADCSPALAALCLLLVGAVEQLATECEQLGRVIASRTDHLA